MKSKTMSFISPKESSNFICKLIYGLLKNILVKFMHHTSLLEFIFCLKYNGKITPYHRVNIITNYDKKRHDNNISIYENSFDMQ